MIDLFLNDYNLTILSLSLLEMIPFLMDIIFNMVEFLRFFLEKRILFQIFRLNNDGSGQDTNKNYILVKVNFTKKGKFPQEHLWMKMMGNWIGYRRWQLWCEEVSIRTFRRVDPTYSNFVKPVHKSDVKLKIVVGTSIIFQKKSHSFGKVIAN